MSATPTPSLSSPTSASPPSPSPASPSPSPSSSSPLPNDGYYEVYWPRAPRQVSLVPLARRPESLSGKRVAQLWDYLFRGDEIFAILEEELDKRFPNIQWVSWREFGNTHGYEEREVLANFAKKFKALKIDAAISGMGC